jgi:hypothetical protein
MVLLLFVLCSWFCEYESGELLVLVERVGEREVGEIESGKIDER